MAPKIDNKKVLVAELAAIAKNSISAIAAENRGLTVSETTQLRQNSRKAKVTMRVYKNKLAQIALKDTEFACLTDTLKGPIVLFFSQEEPGAAARVLRDFVKVNEKLQVRALAMSGQLLGPDRLQSIASLPSRDEAIAQLMAVMKAPITKLVRTFSEPYAQAVRVIAAIRDQKQTA